VGIGTVCSVTLNGVLLSCGIPTISRFGGLLEIRNRKPLRFVELIHYEGTTLDPLEIFIKSGMTNYTDATATGSGLIGAGSGSSPPRAGTASRKSPGTGKDRAWGVMVIGWPGQPLLKCPSPKDGSGRSSSEVSTPWPFWRNRHPDPVKGAGDPGGLSMPLSLRGTLGKDHGHPVERRRPEGVSTGKYF
jgi:hypothetical protein